MKTSLTNQRRTGSVAITLALLLTSWPLYAQPSRMEQGQITSAALATNLFGDPATRTYRVYLPPSYDTSARRYPVVYALHGWYVDENHMVSQLQPTLDSMIRLGTIGEMIVVFPNARNALLGSYYLRSPVIGDYETYIVKDLVALIDARYRTLAMRESRGLTGLSMGGWGTMHLAFKFPDVFSVAVPVAGNYNSRSADRDAKARQLAAWHPRNLTEFSSMVQADWHLGVVQAQYAGLLPNPQRPSLYTDYPYEWVDGQAVLSDSADERCRSGDVQNGDLSRYLLQPVRLRGIKIIHGTADADTPVADARDFTNALTQAGVEFEYQEHPGVHEYRAELALPFLSAHLEGAVVTRHVNANSANPRPPYTTWATAAKVIQDAVDAAAPGDEIVVTNGVYATGGRAVGTNLLVNRVAVDRPVTLRSINGPEVTIIQGYQVPGTTNGDGAVRCVYLANGASLSGFTLTNGATSLFGDSERELCGGGVWCESVNAVVSNCILRGNSAYGVGGGAYGGTLNNCTLTGNSATGHDLVCGAGGGAASATLNNCTLTGNNAAWGPGGGSFFCTLKNCLLVGNNSAFRGGGASGGTLINCTLTGNTARIEGGGAENATLENCIVYYNTALAGVNYGSDCILNSCCTAPQPPPWQGDGNISLDPQLASSSHLSATSPCRGAGSAAYASGTDIDGEAWATPPSIGCDEYHAGTVTGPLGVDIAVAFTNVSAGFPVELTALIEGRISGSVWEFGDGVVVSNQPYVSHAWMSPGTYAVVLQVYNESAPTGVSATVFVHIVKQPVHFVSASGTNPLPPYTSWATAATNIQDAVYAASVTGAMVLVTNGIYASGGRTAGTNLLMNRVAVDKPLALRSVNGPGFTVIKGYQVPGTTNGDGAFRCVYLANHATLSGFTLTNGATGSWGPSDFLRETCGGGLWCESFSAVVSNCVLAANSAVHFGGGVYGGTLNNCILTGNSAGGGGGGARDSALNNCTLTGNSARVGGGAYVSALNNCIVYFNTAAQEANHASWAILNHCCTTPMPTEGVGNITNAPVFVDYAAGNLRLQSNSPCINAGNNSYLTDSNFTNCFDLDGNPRVVNGTVDIGAYEFQGPGSAISYAWLQQFGLATDGSADLVDLDADGHSTWQEWHCQTCPTNALSALRLLSATPLGSGVTVTWQSVADVNYLLERSTDLASPFVPLASRLAGQPGTTSFTDTNAVASGPCFYRVRVGE